MVDIVTRQQWGARRPTSVKQIAVPTRELWLHHTAGAGNGASGVRATQRYHMDTKGWSDIAYSYLVDADGTVYEGRGPAVAGAHTRNHNSISHAICAIGDYQQEQPTERLVHSIARLVRHGHERGWWPATLTGGHRDVGSTACPGQHLYSRIGEINRMASSEQARKEDEMRQGDSGKDVLALQARLNAWRSENLVEDGDYGPNTVAAVKRWQAKAGIEQHGRFGIAALMLLLDNAHRNGHLGGPETSGPHDHPFAPETHKHKGTVEVT